MFADSRKAAIDCPFHGDAQRCQRIVVDHFLARREDQLQRRCIDDVDAGTPCVPAQFFHFNRLARHRDAMKVDARRILGFRAIFRENADPTPLPFLDVASAIEEILSLHLDALEPYRKRIMARRVQHRRIEWRNPGFEKHDRNLGSLGN